MIYSLRVTCSRILFLQILCPTRRTNSLVFRHQHRWLGPDDLRKIPGRAAGEANAKPVKPGFLVTVTWP